MPHLEVRLVHDKAYAKGGTYKKYTDKPYSRHVNRGVVIAFIFSFFIFQGLQQIFPYLSLWNPREVQSASTTVTWTTTDHFSNNGPEGSNFSGTVMNSGILNSNDYLQLEGSQFDLQFQGGRINSVSGGISLYGDHIFVFKTGTVEKRFKSNGQLDSSFGVGGIASTAITDYTTRTGGIKVDSSGIYIAGGNKAGTWSRTYWRMQKLDITTGNSLWSTYTNTNIDYNENLISIDIDSQYVYYAGNEYKSTSPTGFRWRIEKRNKSNGSLVGSVTNIPTTNNYGVVEFMKLSGSNLYIGGQVGTNSGGNLRIEKRQTSNLALITSFGSSGGLDFTTSPIPGASSGIYPYGAYLTTYGDYIYIGATNYSSGYKWYVQKRSSADGSLISSFGNNGSIIDLGTGEIIRYIEPSFDGSSLYISSNSYFSSLSYYRLLKISSDIGSPDLNFGDNGNFINDNGPLSGNVIYDGDFLFYEGGGYLNKIYSGKPSYSTGILSNLKIDAGDGKTASWSTINWNGTNPTNTSIKFRTRGASTEAGLTSATWSSYYTTSGSSIATAASQWLEIEMTLESSDGANTPTLNDFSVTYSTLESPQNSNIVLTKTNNDNLKDSTGNTITGGVPGAWTNESSIRVNASGLTCVDCGDSTNRRPEVEVKPIATPFDGTGTFAAGSGYDYVDVTGLSAGNYHLRVRAIDDQGRASGWTSYGGNADGQTDFSIDQTPPEGTITINNGATLTNTENVTVNVTASDAGSKFGKLYLSNDGTTWEDKTPASGFVGEATYSGNISWALTSSDDGTRNVYLRVVDNGGNKSGTWVQTNDADFNAGTKQGDVLVANNSILIQSDWVSGNVPGLQIYKNDLSGTYQYKTTDTSCDTPQCSQDGGQDGDELVSPQIYTDVDFTQYPAQNACKAIGGRIPSITELASIYSERVSYGFSPIYDYYVTSLEYSSSFYYVYLMQENYPEGNISKTIPYNVRCVRDYSSEVTGGQLISSTNDSSTPQSYGSLSWSADVPSQAGADALRFQVASNNDNTTWNYIGPDGTDQSYYTTSGTQLHSSHNGHRYIRYKAYLQTADANHAPTVYDVSIEVLTSVTDSITLDTQPPGDFGLVSPANNIWSATEPNPIFTWSASSGHDKYQLWIDGELDTDDIDSATTSITASAPLDEGNHTWLVKAVDAAENITEALGGARNYGYDATPPPNVTGLSAPTGDATPTSIIVRWNAVTDVGSGVVGYTLERKRYDSATWSGPTYASFNLGLVTSYNDTGLDQGYRYNYRIKAYDAVNLFSSEYATVEGFTVDTIPPSDPSGVTAVATDSGDTAGYEISLSWNPSTDNGSGLEKYKVWRRAATNDTREVNNSGQDITNTETQVWTLIGVVNGPGPISSAWVDNDTNNDAVVDVKTVASPRLNDYTNYHYRIVAVDAAGNHSKIITVDPVLGLPDYTNYKSERTVDVTAPSIPGNLTVTPTGVDSLGGEPLTQAMEITWGASTDTRTPGRTPTGNGSGVKEYKLYRATGTVSGHNNDWEEVAASENTNCPYPSNSTCYLDEGLSEDSFYYYRVLAIDDASKGGGIDNLSAPSAEESALTKNSQVPTTPTNVNVTAKTGDPNLDSEVGSKITITFTGSRIKGSGNRVDGYRIYRSTTNYTSQSQWTALSPIYTFNNLNIPAETQDGQRSYVDTAPSDATRYYYKVQAFGWNESNYDGSNQDTGVVISPSLSSIQVDTLHTGWDITPDATPPAQPQEVKVKDIHGNDSLYRNIVTWAKVSDSDRNGTDDFSHYEVWRYESLLGVASAVKISSDNTYTDSGFNYFVDGISRSAAEKDYSYYVVAKDNAKTEFKYANGTVINPYSNSSGFSGVASINPSVSTPTVASVSHKNVGVSTATIEWSTNQPCDSLVEYRIKNSQTVIAAGKNRTNPVTSHTVELVGLEKGSDYQYRIVSRNSLGNIDTEAATTWREFKTADFTITNVKVNSTTTTATVSWDTNIDSDSSVEYKEESALGAVQQSQTAGDPNLSKSHEVVIKALKPDTNYTYKIRSVSTDKFIAETAFASFRTKPFDASQFTITPNASSIAEQNITATSAKIVWETLVATTTWVDYGTRSGTYNQSAGDNKYNTVHVVELKNLTPGQTYYYRVRGVDANNVEYTSREYSFTAVLEPEITGLRINLVDSYTAVVTFNTNVDTEAAVTYGADGKADLKAGTTEYKRNHIITLENLEDGKTYGYFVEVRDKINNVKRNASSTFDTPIDRTGAKVQNLKIDILPMSESDETASIIISWTSSKPTTTKVVYDEGVTAGELGKSTIEDESLNTSHTVIIKDLSPSTSYQFKIAGKDRRGNETESQAYTFVTPAQEKSILQLIIRSLEETFAWTKNLGNFFRNLREKVR